MRGNLLAGLGSSLWSALLGLAVVPVYLRFLGLEAYGLVGLFATAQALFSLLDLGLAPAINREVARAAAAGRLRPARELLHTLGRIYWLTAVVIAVFAALAAPLLARHWLNSRQLPIQTVSNAIALMGLVVACRWPIGLYSGALIGAQKVAWASGVAVVMATAGNLGAIAVLAWVSPDIESFFLWQALVGVLYALTMRATAWHAIGREPGIRFSVPALLRIWRFSAGVSGVALSALILTQADKIVLSRLLSLSSFGQYSLATLVVSGLYLLITPAFNVTYPRFTALVASGRRIELTNLYRASTRLFAMTLFPIAMLLAVFAQDLVTLWIGDAQLAAQVAPVIALLTAGSALHGVMFFPYALQLAHGNTRLPFTINMILLVTAVPLMVSLAWLYGIGGGASAVLVLFVLYLLLGTWLTHRQLLTAIGWAWLVRDVCAPLAASLVVGLAGRSMLAGNDWTGLQKAGLGLGMLLGAWIVSLAVAPRTTLPQLLRLLKVDNG